MRSLDISQVRLQMVSFYNEILLYFFHLLSYQGPPNSTFFDMFGLIMTFSIFLLIYFFYLFSGKVYRCLLQLVPVHVCLNVWYGTLPMIWSTCSRASPSVRKYEQPFAVSYFWTNSLLPSN